MLTRSTKVPSREKDTIALAFLESQVLRIGVSYLPREPSIGPQLKLQEHVVLCLLQGEWEICHPLSLIFVNELIEDFYLLFNRNAIPTRNDLLESGIRARDGVIHSIEPLV